MVSACPMNDPVNDLAALTDDELRARIAAHRWFHSIMLRPGIVTAGAKTPEVMAAEEEALFSAVRVEGASVVDIGAWNGYFSFAAKRRGAASVLATDQFTWLRPEFRGRETIELARRELGLDITLLEVDPTAITAELGQFDIVLFLGVFYHLFDPIDVMKRMRAITGGVLLIETHQDALGHDRPMMVFYPGTTLQGDPTNWWGPNPPLVLHMLLELGFERIEYRNHPTLGAARGIYAAFLPGAFERLGGRFDDPWIGFTHPR
jgi:tRNA (mo5U34)-methyltransferase